MSRSHNFSSRGQSQTQVYGFIRKLRGCLHGIGKTIRPSQRISRDPRRFYVEEFPVLLIDAMGVKQTLPFRMFIVYEVCKRCITTVFAVTHIPCPQRFAAYIKDYFRDSPGRGLIQREKFALTDESGNAIRKSTWAQKIQPGSKVDMSVVIRRSDLGVEDCCPKCRSQILPHSRTWWATPKKNTS